MSVRLSNHLPNRIFSLSILNDGLQGVICFCLQNACVCGGALVEPTRPAQQDRIARFYPVRREIFCDHIKTAFIVCEPDFDFTRLPTFATAGGQVQVLFPVEIIVFEL